MDEDHDRSFSPNLAVNTSVAVIADEAPWRQFRQQLDAAPTEQAIEKSSSYDHSPRDLPEEWRNRMLQEYGCRSEIGALVL